MGISLRHYLFPEDGPLRRVPQRIVDELPSGRDAIPEFAGRRQRVAHVVLESAEGKPARILDARGEYWTFDDEGRVSEDMYQRMIERLDLLSEHAGSKRGPIVDLVPEIKKRELQARHEWTITADDLDRVAADLWPGIDGDTPEVTTVKGAKPRKPPLTHEARWALDDVLKHVNAIKHRLENLSERALKGLAFEAIRSSLWEDEALWRGIADHARQREAIRAAHRTGRGEWYAVIEVARASRDHPYVWEEVAVAHEKCSTRKAAVEAGRRLMAEKSEWLGPDMEISVNVRSALEWRPEDWE